MADELFAVQLGKFARAVPERAQQVVRKAALQLTAEIVMATPVGNPTLWKHKPPKGYVGGRLRANWNAAIGGADVTTTNAIDKEGASTIGRAEALLATAPAGDIYITNTLPYAIAIEYGHSGVQAPAGMVRVAVTHFQTFVDRAAQDLKK